MNLIDDLRDTTASITYVPDIFVSTSSKRVPGEDPAFRGRHGETPFYGYRGVTNG